MTDIIFHKSDKYIDDDIDYYASDTRDKHGAVKPRQDIKSYLLDSLIFDNNSALPSIYYPFQKSPSIGSILELVSRYMQIIGERSF